MIKWRSQQSDNDYVDDEDDYDDNDYDDDDYDDYDLLENDKREESTVKFDGLDRGTGDDT